ncbi:hypothetical protein [Flavobacterium hungaricum]|uniref:Uncharacterized protein n=1 Tax=Flavobacterium hungaricum TaxID=2082725 RepID=A0ABR9TQE5_9FLAO|nr:hypothetical protein [Flavobacterium hungaricum]MBE8727227.1 hypothetical protein [Flavobacterium hungaricum]
MDNIDFNDLWKKQTVSQSSIEDLKNRIKQFKKASLRSVLKTNLVLFATSAFIIFIWIYYQPQFISTKIGIVVTILAMVIYVVVYNRLLKHYKEIDANLTNQEYLQKLIVIKKKQQFMQTKVLSLYFLLLMAGIFLYMYEYASRMKLYLALITYGVTFLWIAFNWFYIRPKQIKKHQDKINSLVEKFEEINNQF